MLRSARRAAICVGLCVALLGRVGFAQPALDIERMAFNLKNGSDFRVRTQAALALGASKNERAVAPLCSALGDANTTVRAAAAAALGKLQLGGNECLEARAAREPSATVKAAIQRALELVGGGEPAIDSSTKYYVSIGKTTDKSGRTGDGIDRMVRRAMVSAARSLGIAIAPAVETVAQAKQRLGRHRGLKAFYLAPRVSPFNYSAGDLKVRLEIAFFTYPDKALLGNYAVPLTQQGVPSADRTAEDELLVIAAERAMEKLVPIAARIQ